MQPEAYSITLAAGAGSRMPGDMPPKACCKIGPLSVIENALDSYERAGIQKHVVVVGSQASRIMEEVCRKRPDVLFAYQSEPRGTGDAVRCGLELLLGVGPPEHVLICAGDKVIAPRTIRGLMETYAASGCDLCLVAGLSRLYPGCGRIVVRNDRVEAIVEMPDIKAMELAALLRSLPEDNPQRTVGDLRKLSARYIPSSDKLAAYFPTLSKIVSAPSEKRIVWDDVRAAVGPVPGTFQLPGGPLSAEEAEASRLCNLSVYACRFGPLREAVQTLRSDNVQGEWYFTDVVEILASSGCRVALFRVEDPEDVMAFNTLEQLEVIRGVHAARASSRRQYPRLQRWINYFAARGDSDLPARAVKGLGEKIGVDRPCIVVRSPGRINLMGRHIDHQGGMCNLMAIDRGIVIAASPREDDRVRLWNSDPSAYPYRSFTFGELAGDIDWENWLRALESQFVQRMASTSAGDWANYAKGAALRLLHRFRDRKMRGFDAFVCGNIPVAAGLSSSSALVVAVAQALTELNGLNVRPREFVDLCGEGEWFVGPRGGSADHAAIMLGREREVVSFSFFPFEVEGRYPFPEDCAIIIGHSGARAQKTRDARQRINARVACFHIARELIKAQFPRFAPLIQHLRDVNTRSLDISLPALYSLIRQLPTRIGPGQVESLAEQHVTVAKCVSELDMAEHEFPVRDVALYGLAECERAARTGALLEKGDMRGLGEMMNISHDGDRVLRWSPHPAPFDSSATDELMDCLIRESRSCVQTLSDSRAALWQQPGAYDCSIPEIDLMVDRVLECPGVMGAQLAGAGLGGCIMVLVENERIGEALDLLEREYYLPRGLEPEAFVCQPARGSQVFTTVEAGEKGQ